MFLVGRGHGSILSQNTKLLVLLLYWSSLPERDVPISSVFLMYLIYLGYHVPGAAGVVVLLYVRVPEHSQKNKMFNMFHTSDNATPGQHLSTTWGLTQERGNVLT